MFIIIHPFLVTFYFFLSLFFFHLSTFNFQLLELLLSFCVFLIANHMLEYASVYTHYPLLRTSCKKLATVLCVFFLFSSYWPHKLPIRLIWNTVKKNGVHIFCCGPEITTIFSPRRNGSRKGRFFSVRRAFETALSSLPVVCWPTIKGLDIDLLFPAPT